MADSLDLENMPSRIKTLRKSRNMTLDQLAAAAGLAKSYVWEIENAKKLNPTVRTVWAISDALGVAPAHLIGADPNVARLEPLAHQIASMIDRHIANLTPGAS